MRREEFNDLLEQLGPLLQPHGIHAFPNSVTWGIALDEDQSLLLDFDEDGRKLVLSADLGAPHSGELSPLYEMLLRHNYLWHETGGVRLALDGPDGAVHQIVDLPTQNLTLQRLDGAIRVFADAARAWREIIRRPRQSDRQAMIDDVGAILFRV